jgi:hypothetical protein
MEETQEQRAERQERFSQAQLPRLNEIADNLEAITRDAFEKRIAYTRDNGADVMALSFVTKQYEHLRSVRMLIAAELHRDALLIARTMIEGLGRLLWAFNKVPERTDLWFWFGAILDWRQTLKNEAAGMVIDPDDKAELKTWVDKYGPNYYRDNVRKSLDAEKDGTVFDMPDDPWRNDWTPTKIESMFQEVEGTYLYESVYRRTSEWIHWGPRSILMAMESAEGGVAGFTQEDWRSAASALMWGCLSLLQSLEVLDRHFSLGISERLAEPVKMIEALNAEVSEAGG